jgi:HK97 family phage major capsid protein
LSLSDIIALRQERSQKIAAARAIHDKATSENRDFTAAESKAYDRALAEVRTLAARVEREEGLSDLGPSRGTARGLSGRALPDTDNRGGVTDLEFHTALAGELRDLATGTSGFGGIFPTDYQPYVFDRLAPHATFLTTNPTVVVTEKHSITLPAYTADAAAAWVAEAGAISETDPAAQTLTITPTKVAALTKISRESADDSNPALAELVMNNIARSVGLAIDLAGYWGTGASNQPTGIGNTAGITTQFMGTNGAAPTNLDFLLTALATLESANADMSKVVLAMHPRTVNELFALKDSQNRYLMQSVSSGGSVARSVDGIPIVTSTQFPTNEVRGTSGAVCSSVLAYDPSQVVFVKAHDVRLEATNSAYFANDQIGLRCIARVGIGIPNPAAVVRVAGIL